MALPHLAEVLGALLVLAVFLVVLFLLGRFRDAGFTALEAVLVLVAAPLLSGVDVPLAPLGRGVVLGVNLGGALVPLLVAARLVARGAAPWRRAAVVALLAGLVASALAVVVPERGIVLGNLLAPVAVAVVAAWLLARGRRRQTAPLAYAGGTVGAVVGLDLLHLGELVQRSGGGFYSIGGAGTGDAVFLVGIGAVVVDLLVSGLARRGR